MPPHHETSLDHVAVIQGKLFEFVVHTYPGTDVEDFIIAYMTSKTRKYIDEAPDSVAAMDAAQLWEYFLRTDGYIFKPGKPLTGFNPAWTGQFYTYYQQYFNLPSAEVICAVPVSFLQKAYPVLRDMPLAKAVQEAGRIY